MKPARRCGTCRFHQRRMHGAGWRLVCTWLPIEEPKDKDDSCGQWKEKEG